MINLFEYENKEAIPESLDGLEAFLDEIWASREKSGYYASEDDPKQESQKFLQFIHKTNEFKSTKYAGVIHFNGEKINLLPKIFFDPKKEYEANEITQIQNHILWWLSYCRKIKFPNYLSALGNTKSDFFEVLIYLFSKYTRELLSSSIYQQYEEVNRELQNIKGRLNTPVYIRENLAKGNWHKLNCTYDAFVFDNEFNRIIKHVVTMLFNVSGNQENKKYLREILFILDEVSDEPATAEQCARISFNPMFGEFETVRDYCHLFLSNSISFDYKNDLKLFAFLLPMEYVFEDFIFGFIDKELPEVNARAQRSDTYLDTDQTFALKPDLWLKLSDRNLIADTKYKVVYTDERDPKKGISQNDLYQMLSYAVRFKVNEIILFYPNTISQNQEHETHFTIRDELAEGSEVYISAYQVPIIKPSILQLEVNTSMNLEDLFHETKEGLRNRLEGILSPKVE